jgi:spore maturation protein CgeB
MSRKFRIAYFAHAIRSDWNNGNAHFLRGLLRSLIQIGHDVQVYEPENGWSLENLLHEEKGQESLRQFEQTYPELQFNFYDGGNVASPDQRSRLREVLRETEFVILHEWNPPELAHCLLELREELGFKLLFHDTHHRASSSPEQIRRFGTDQFDGVLAFGEALRSIYRERFNMQRVWTLHEAADTTMFYPKPDTLKVRDLVWIGNWGDDERSAEICQFLLRPAEMLRNHTFTIFGVRYPAQALAALENAGVAYGGYLPNLAGPQAYAESQLTMHIPRQQYAGAMAGIPTIRVFEALACGIPLISAPWRDSEHLFGEDDFWMVRNSNEARAAMEALLNDSKRAEAQASRGLASVLARHTCMHRAEELTAIFEEIVK